jgi:hypothetical protein
VIKGDGRKEREVRWRKMKEGGREREEGVP